MASKYFGKVKRYYDAGVWSRARVKNAVYKGWITAAEFGEITGEEYRGEADE